MTKFRVSKDAFGKSLNTAAAVVGNRASMPIIKNVKISVKDNTAEISATNLEQVITVKLNVNGESDGEFVVDARQLSCYINRLPHTELTISYADRKLTIDGANSHAALACEDVDDYPNLPAVEGEAAEIEVVKLKRLAQISEFCIHDMTRPVMSGVEVWNGTAVASDGYRLAVDNKFIDMKRCLIPADFLRRISTIDLPAKVKLVTSEEQLSIVSDSTAYTTRLIDGKGIADKVASILPKDSDIKAVKVNANDLKLAISTASTLGDKDNYIDITANEDNTLTISSASRVSSAAITIETDSTSGIAGNVYRFNSKFVNSVLALCVSDEIALELGQVELKPLAINDNGYDLMVMPITRD